MTGSPSIHTPILIEGLSSRSNHDRKAILGLYGPQHLGQSDRRRGDCPDGAAPARARRSGSAPAPVPVPPSPSPAPPAPSLVIAAQKAKLKLSDGRTATFVFSACGASLACAAAVGLDEVLGYTLAPVNDPPPPSPRTAAGPPSAAPAPGARAFAHAAGGEQSSRAVHLRSAGADRPARQSAGDSHLAGPAILPRQALPAGRRMPQRHVSP